MNKKELITPFLVIGFSTLFAVICLGVFLSNGKSKKWVARKMKVGGLLLAFTAISTGSGCFGCYKPVTNAFDFENLDYGKMEINIDSTNQLKGTIENPESQVYSFTVEDTTSHEIRQTGNVKMIEKKSRKNDYDVQLELETNLATGIYYINFFPTEITKQEGVYPVDKIILMLKNE